jgi:hypothetical protein
MMLERSGPKSAFAGGLRRTSQVTTAATMPQNALDRWAAMALLIQSFRGSEGHRPEVFPMRLDIEEGA